MMLEDQRSRLAEDYLKECEAWKKETLDMKARAAQLKLGDAFSLNAIFLSFSPGSNLFAGLQFK